jgi:hypothetical protein
MVGWRKDYGDGIKTRALIIVVDASVEIGIAVWKP